MAVYLIPSSIEFGYGGLFPVPGSAQSVYATGPREIRFTLFSDEGVKGSITIPLEGADEDRTLAELVEHATERAKAMVAEALF